MMDHHSFALGIRVFVTGLIITAMAFTVGIRHTRDSRVQSVCSIIVSVSVSLVGLGLLIVTWSFV